MAKSTAPSTQEHLPIAGIQDGVVIMTDGSVRAILKLEPINFDLKSEQEQNSIIYAYQGFLNSLDFPIQIVVQSKKLDLERYLMRMGENQKNLNNDLLKIQTEDYIGFVRRLISVANIMSKRFYIVISYATIKNTSGTTQISGLFHRQPSGPLMDQDQFERFQGEVNNRANIIAGGIGRLGVKSSLLDTQQLIELFYGVYNPDVATEERLTDVATLNAGIVSSPESLAPVAEEFLEPVSTTSEPTPVITSQEGLLDEPDGTQPVEAPLTPVTSIPETPAEQAAVPEPPTENPPA